MTFKPYVSSQLPLISSVRPFVKHSRSMTLALLMSTASLTLSQTIVTSPAFAGGTGGQGGTFTGGGNGGTGSGGAVGGLGTGGTGSGIGGGGLVTQELRGI